MGAGGLAKRPPSRSGSDTPTVSLLPALFSHTDRSGSECSQRAELVGELLNQSSHQDEASVHRAQTFQPESRILSDPPWIAVPS